MTDRQRVGVLVVAYNAESTLRWVLDRLPPTFRERVDHVLVCDDASHDDTHRIGLDYQSETELPLTIVKHPVNLGYGGNQKFGYRWAIEHGLDIVVMLHGDGQYAPEVIESLVEPLESGVCDAVFGSRMMTRGDALVGGMPPYKYVGNRILSSYENLLAGMELTEWHSGYRAYRTDALADIPFERNSDVFNFDTEIILQLHEAGKTIREVPIPTYYGDEICHVNGMKYAFDVVTDVTRYRLHKLGFGDSAPAAITVASQIRMAPGSLYGRLHEQIVPMTPGRALVLGCGDGQFAQMLIGLGWTVTGVEDTKHPDLSNQVHEMIETTWGDGLADQVGTGYDLVVAADVLNRVRDAGVVLDAAFGALAPSGQMLVGTANFAHWYPRIRHALGLFAYDRRGTLDHRHLRFFTRRSFVSLAAKHGWRVRASHPAGVPMEQLDWGGRRLAKLVRPLAWFDRTGVRAWPNLFALQWVHDLVAE